MEARAVARTVRIAPRKVELVLDLIRDKNTVEAIVILKLTSKASSPAIGKVLMSALASVEHNYGMNTDELVVREAYANEGPTSERLRPRTQGHASTTNKCTSHIAIVISDGKEEAKEA